MQRLVQTYGLAHGGLDVEGLDVLPVLLEQRDQEIDCHLNVNVQLLLGERHIADSDTQAQHLLQLVLDGGLDLVDLVLQGVVMGDEGGELTSLVEAGAEQTGDHLDDRVGSQESSVPLGKLLHELLILVQLLEVVHGHGIHTESSGLFAMLNITKDAHLHLRARAERELDGAAETLIFLGVIVLKPDLQLDGLSELTRLGSGALQNREHWEMN